MLMISIFLLLQEISSGDNVMESALRNTLRPVSSARESGLEERPTYDVQRDGPYKKRFKMMRDASGYYLEAPNEPYKTLRKTTPRNSANNSDLELVDNPPLATEASLSGVRGEERSDFETLEKCLTTGFHFVDVDEKKFRKDENLFEECTSNFKGDLGRALVFLLEYFGCTNGKEELMDKRNAYAGSLNLYEETVVRNRLNEENVGLFSDINLRLICNPKDQNLYTKLIDYIATNKGVWRGVLEAARRREVKRITISWLSDRTITPESQKQKISVVLRRKKEDDILEVTQDIFLMHEIMERLIETTGITKITIFTYTSRFRNAIPKIEKVIDTILFPRLNSVSSAPTTSRSLKRYNFVIYTQKLKEKNILSFIKLITNWDVYVNYEMQYITDLKFIDMINKYGRLRKIYVKERVLENLIEGEKDRENMLEVLKKLNCPIVIHTTLNPSLLISKINDSYFFNTPPPKEVSSTFFKTLCNSGSKKRVKIVKNLKNTAQITIQNDNTLTEHAITVEIMNNELRGKWNNEKGYRIQRLFEEKILNIVIKNDFIYKNLINEIDTLERSFVCKDTLEELHIMNMTVYKTKGSNEYEKLNRHDHKISLPFARKLIEKASKVKVCFHGFCNGDVATCHFRNESERLLCYEHRNKNEEETSDEDEFIDVETI